MGSTSAEQAGFPPCAAEPEGGRRDSQVPSAAAKIILPIGRAGKALCGAQQDSGESPAEGYEDEEGTGASLL